MRGDPGRERGLREHGAGLAQRHKQTRKEARHARRMEEPRQHRLAGDELVADVLQTIGPHEAACVGFLTRFHIFQG